MPICRVSSTATKSSVKLKWSKAVEKQRRGFSVEAKTGVNAVMSYIEGTGGHEKASFVAYLNKKGVIEIARKRLIFKDRLRETVSPQEYFQSGLLRLWQLTQANVK